ncbi:YqzE family protein [Bacillus taeanensis]|uniref:YqzE family protein n=1 Tax=Bacillus taeanensis TaxID=273032 RepID=A0A366Y2E4_9BACI|nr:YqzE family protein [Bacillus taeanensis]RBW70583.1 YqzE family protein [Bacillus taeanensis]
MSSNDYVKYMTEQIVEYISQPKEAREEIKNERKSNRPPFLYRWFGMIPLALTSMFKKQQS